MWFKKIDKDLPIPFKEYTGHKSFVYYKKTKSGKNISLNLAWLKYNGAIQLLSQERILSFCLLENSKMKGLIRKGSKKDIILKESEENADMLKNADNFNTSGENVKENNR